MAILARWQATITDNAGNVVPGAAIEVRREIPGQPPAQCFSDRNGLDAIGSTFNADGDGFAAFHVPGGVYQIKATSGAFERVWRYVGIGTASETDIDLPDQIESLIETAAAYTNWHQFG